MNIEIKIENKELEARKIRETSEKSEFTDKDLEVLEIKLVSNSEITIPNIIKSTGGKEWETINQSYTQRGIGGGYLYSLTIKEHEDLEELIEELIIDNLKLKPYRYEEHIENESITIVARVKLNDAEWKEILDVIDENKYFTVIRKGLSNNEKMMRIWISKWSEDGEKIKCEIALFEKSQTSNNIRSTLNPERINIEGDILILLAGYNELLSVLSEKGVISDSNLERIKNKQTEEFNKTSNLVKRFQKVKNIDKF